MIFTITSQHRSKGMITNSVVRTVWKQRYTLQKQNSGYHFIRAPLGAGAYPRILSKYFPSIHLSPYRLAQGVYIVCKTLYLCGLLVVFGSYLEYNAVTPFSSQVLYQFLHTSFFFLYRSPKYVGSQVVLSPYTCMQAVPIPSPYLFFLYGGPKYVGSQICTQSLHMYVGCTNSFSVRFFVL